jgi:hypothetical protein
MKKLFAVLLFALASLAHAQATVPPAAATFQVNLSWTGPASCTTAAPCTYTVYRAPAGGTYALLGTTAAQTTTYSDLTTTPGSAYTYIVETVYEGVNSAPSNPVAVTVPAVPNAPTVIIITIAP